ncbi:C39 family peptidase, partial [Akkermansiaceae bacterium]|nr:C39 family peptidase [Akkermansiaceae bacterium]
MKLLHTFSLIAFLLANVEAKKVMLDLSSDTGDKLRAELIDLENDTALLRRSDGKEFATPLAYLSGESRVQLKKLWQEYQAEVSKTLAPLNEALGHPLFSKTGNLWNEPIADIAKRLKWPEESSTPFTSSYRLYTRPGYKFAGAQPKTVVAYGNETGKAESISLIYSNKGDSLSTVGAGEDHFKENGKSIDRGTLEGAMIYDTRSIAKTLTAILGEPTEQRILGQGNKTHKTQRWDWLDHAFLLTHVKEEYVGLRITKSLFADNGGKHDRISDGEMRDRLKGNVVTKPNGDVFIDHIPMVDQGPKGYCAPATFERAMRHAGVAADMYLLATLATTGGGGTNTSKLYDEVAFTTRSKGSRTAREIELRSLSPSKIQKYIDKGVPLLWQMCSLPTYNTVANKRTMERRTVKDWPAYAAKIAAESESNLPQLQAKGNYHICMIIGYNAATNEVAVSDSWGKHYSIRWIHVD